MMLRLNVDKLCQAIKTYDGFRIVGRVHSTRGMLTAKLPAAVGELCRVELGMDRSFVAEVIGFDRGVSQLMPYQKSDEIVPGAMVMALGRRIRVPVGPALLGRVINGLGQPIDGRGPLRCATRVAARPDAPEPLSRPRIVKPFMTGQRVIDGLLTLGRGQRVGLFAGSGVGKSTLLGEIA
ncbi:MAG: EscN/YscN/HrcN family type III secretion system ATPase, partial [Planctomycetaceae bacterium]